MEAKTKNVRTHLFRIFLARHKLLLAVLGGALMIRIWGIWNADSTDEYNEVFEALRVCSGQLNYERWFKRFYLYILALEYGFYYAVGWILQWFASPSDFAAKIIRDLTPLFLMARSTSALAGTLSVFMTYLIGSRLYGRNAGLIAALFLCFNSANIELSHYARVDATLCAVVLVSFYFIVCIFQNGNERKAWNYAFAGLFMGIAFQNKAPAIVLVIPFLFAHMALFDFRITSPAPMNRYMAVTAFCFLMGLLIGNPALLFAPMKFLQGVIATGDAFSVPINESESPHIGYVVYLMYFYRELGIPLCLLGLYSVGSALISRRREDILLLSFMVPFYGLMGASRYMVGYSYMIPLMPFLYLLCSQYLVSGVEKFTVDHVRSRIFLPGALAVLLIYPLANAVELIASFSGQNTRYLAKEWIEQHVPFGSKVLMDSGKTINSTAPQIAQDRDSLLRTIQELERKIETGTLRDTTKMVDQNAVKYYKMLLQTVPQESYDITSTKFGLEVQSIEYYREHGYQYIIISQSMKLARTDQFTMKRYPSVAAFYSSLDRDPRLLLIKEIKSTRTNAGDTFYVYKVH